VQGSTLPLLIRRLRIVGTSVDADRVELAGLLSEIGGLGASTLDNPDLRQDNGDPFDAQVIEQVRQDSLLASEAVSELTETESVGPLEQRRALRLRVLQAERAALLDARSTGTYSSRITESAAHMLDLEETRLIQLGGGGDEH
jgi:CPA1 family monovalent cation:H+ antiporter